MNKKLTLALFVLMVVCPSAVLAQDTQGFFLNDFQAKSAETPPYIEATKTTNSTTVSISIDATDTIAKVSKYVFGANANLWMGKIVTQSNLMTYISNLSPNVIRFPGGSISDYYFWASAKDQPPSDAPSYLYNSSGTSVAAGYWYGGNDETWTISLDNYYTLLEETGSTGLITINYGYARYGTGPTPVQTAAHYAADWVRYDNGRTKYWEIGNENFGSWEAGYYIDQASNQDGQPFKITGALYGEHFKVFVDSMKKAADELGDTIYIGAVLRETSTTQSNVISNWNTGFFSTAGDYADYFVIHNYYTPYQTDATADVILATATTVTDEMMEYLTQLCTDNSVTLKPVALNEWNITSQGSKQQVSFVNGMHATLLLGEAIKNKYGQTSRWDLANGYSSGNDHGMFNIGDESGVPKWNPRPAYFYMYYFQKYFGDRMVQATSGSTDVVCFASSFSSGHLGLVLVNKSTTGAVVDFAIDHFRYGSKYYTYTLTGGTDNGEFSPDVYVNSVEPTNATGGPIDSLLNINALAFDVSGGVKISLPKRSVVYVLLEGQPNGIDDQQGADAYVSVFPNPAHGSFRVNYSQGVYNSVQLFDLSGKLIDSQKIMSSQTYSSYSKNLKPGVYLVKLVGKTGTHTLKLVNQ